MSEKVKKMIKMISSGASSMSLYQKRNYYRHASSIDAEQRWRELGGRLRNAAEKVVNNHQQV
jgi:hypothetical protein